MRKLFITLMILSLALCIYAQGTIVIWGSPQNKVANEVPAGDDFIEIAGGKDYAVALRADGSLVSWGDDNTIENSTPAGTDFIAISAGEQHAIALRANGSVVGWGRNNKGQINPPPYSDFVKISAGIEHNLGLRSNGQLYAWGNTANGRCDFPAGNYTDIAAGNTYSLAINSAGAIVV